MPPAPMKLTRIGRSGLAVLNQNPVVRINRQGIKDAKGQDMSRIPTRIEGHRSQNKPRYFHAPSNGIAK